tara:strand:- start:3832 stop:4065 length:234 start_codon:yes stop_codon:yes gene_type:complete
MKEEYINIGSEQDKVIEEAGEVFQAIGKLNRFGPENFHPDRPKSNNRHELIEELDDCIHAMQVYRKLLYREKYGQDG